MRPRAKIRDHRPRLVAIALAGGGNERAAEREQESRGNCLDPSPTRRPDALMDIAGAKRRARPRARRQSRIPCWAGGRSAGPWFRARATENPPRRAQPEQRPARSPARRAESQFLKSSVDLHLPSLISPMSSAQRAYALTPFRRTRPCATTPARFHQSKAKASRASGPMRVEPGGDVGSRDVGLRALLPLDSERIEIDDARIVGGRARLATAPLP